MPTTIGNSTIKTLIVICIGIIALAIVRYDSGFFIWEVILIFLYVLFGCVILYSLIKLIRHRKSLTNPQKLKNSIFLLFAISFIFLIQFLIETDGGKKKLMSGRSNYMEFELFQDNRFRFFASNPFGGTYYRGIYSLRNDTLTLQNENLRFSYPTLSLVLNKQGDTNFFLPIGKENSEDALIIYYDARVIK